MKTFSRLIFKMRANESVLNVADRIGLAPTQLMDIEKGKLPVNDRLAGRILRQGFGLTTEEIRPLLLGCKLADLGLHDDAIRQVVVGAILGTLTPEAKDGLRDIYRDFVEP